MNYFRIVYSYLQYRRNAVDAFGVHAPFLFDLLQDVVYQKSDPKDFAEIEQLRRRLLNTNSTIRVQDFGAGSRADKGGERKLSRITKYSSKPFKFTALIYRLIKYFQPQQILEIGTSFGISTMYMAKANSKAKISTMEGCPETAAIAQQNFDVMKMKNIELIEGNFDTLLPPFLAANQSMDFVFFDGNHRKEPTLRYFNSCIEKAHSETVFIFDDIHWSEGMEEAWEEIKKDSRTKLCLDFYSIGIVFFKKELTKESFNIKF